MIAQNIECKKTLEAVLTSTLYVLEQKHKLDQKHKNKVYPCKLQFYNVKVWCKGVQMIRVYSHDVLSLRNRDAYIYIYRRNIVMSCSKHRL